MGLLMYKIEAEVKGKVSILERRDLTKKGYFFISCFVVSIRESEGFMMDEAGLRYHSLKGREWALAHVVITFTGKFKGRIWIRHHLQDIFNKRA